MTSHRTIRKAQPETLPEFIDAFAHYFSGSKQLKCYRGQQDSRWPIVAGIFRREFKGILLSEKRAIRELISVQPHEFASDETMFDKLVRMQHFGLPTRLLDVSRNALVALYFATSQGSDTDPEADGIVTAFAVPQELEKYYDSDSVSCISNLSNMTEDEKKSLSRLCATSARKLPPDNISTLNRDQVSIRLLQFIRAEKSYFQPMINPIDLFTPYFVHPKLSNRRILAQSGAFIIYGLIPPGNMFFPYKIEQTQFRVRAATKTAIRNALDNIGINESTLFPEIDRAASRIKQQLKL